MYLQNKPSKLIGHLFFSSSSLWMSAFSTVLSWDSVEALSTFFLKKCTRKTNFSKQTSSLFNWLVFINLVALDLTLSDLQCNDILVFYILGPTNFAPIINQITRLVGNNFSLKHFLIFVQIVIVNIYVLIYFCQYVKNGWKSNCWHNILSLWLRGGE